MQVQKTTVESLFTHERRYVVPLFQRPYVWGREEQWEPLWDDICDIAERNFVAIKNENPDDVIHPHFMGAIVLQSRRVSGDHLPVLDVIDGQQRLTTLQLVLVVLRDLANAKGEAPTAKWATARTANGNALINTETEQYKVWPTQRDQAQFIEIYNAGSCAKLQAKFPAKIGRRKATRPLMVEAYLYFYQAMDEWLIEKGDAVLGCRALRLALQRHLEIVQIDLDETENPQEIFETLNARGVPLLASDLLRNFIFRRAKGASLPDALHKKYWARFEVPENPAQPEGLRFWEVEIRQGRLSRARLDLFVQHYLSMKLERDVRVGELFREYKTWIETRKPFSGVEEELQEFVRYADLFRALLRPDTNSPTDLFAARLHAIDVNSIYPLVIGLLGEPHLPSDERDGIFIDLESFLVRRLVCGRPTKNYTRLFLALLTDFRKGGVFKRAAFRNLLVAGKTESSDWPDDATFELSWNTVDAYKAIKPERVEMLLRAIEMKSRSSKSEPILLKGPLTIEHVMPQSWSAYWPLPAKTDGVDPLEAREEVIHDFGNLTLVTQGLNSTVSNGPAAQKLPELFKHSNLELNKYFVNRTTWTEKDIRDRGKALFELAKEIWPRP
ncbi:MAG: DUF262 domain-containing protein [Polyangiaceae bacterium]|nr:DUF262 domain-containing protein [Polyangiaceae bacterium]